MAVCRFLIYFIKISNNVSPETMCMKGLILTHMSRKEEGMELVKKGLIYDMQSHICWHVLGIIKKADKNWDEALKAYMQAVRCDKVADLHTQL